MSYTQLKEIEGTLSYVWERKIKYFVTTSREISEKFLVFKKKEPNTQFNKHLKFTFLPVVDHKKVQGYSKSQIDSKNLKIRTAFHEESQIAKNVVMTVLKAWRTYHNRATTLDRQRLALQTKKVNQDRPTCQIKNRIFCKVEDFHKRLINKQNEIIANWKMYPKAVKELSSDFTTPESKE